MESSTEPRLPFSKAEFQRRLNRIRQAAAARGLDALVINRPENIYYVTGYHSLGYFAYQVLVVPVADAEPCFVLRYGERSNVWGRSWLQAMACYRDIDDPVAITKRVLQEIRARRIGIETTSWFMTPASYTRLVDAMPSGTFSDCSGLVERERAVKSPEELTYVRAAAALSSRAVRAGLEAVAEGRTDRDIAAAVYTALITGGGEYPPLPPLIAVGPQTTLFHNTWCGQPIATGDVAFLEVPGVVARYLAPLARSASLGQPANYIVERQKVALESLEAGIAAMRPGVTCATVYEAFARPYERAGYEVAIKVGYSVGIAFPPRWSEYEGLNLLPDNQTVLEPGMVFHTPRTVRVYGEQTAIVSETTLITETGHEVLTRAPRALVVR